MRFKLASLTFYQTALLQEVLTLEIAPREANFAEQDTEKKRQNLPQLYAHSICHRSAGSHVFGGIFACRLEIGQSDATCGQWRQRHLSIRSESPDFFRLLTRNHWHAAAEWGWPAKTQKRPLFSLGLETAINQKRPTTISTLLTLHSHPTVDTGSGPNEAEHFLLSCQVHLPLTAAGIWPLIKRKKREKSEVQIQEKKKEKKRTLRRRTGLLLYNTLGTLTLQTSCVQFKARGTINPLIIWLIGRWTCERTPLRSNRQQRVVLLYIQWDEGVALSDPTHFNNNGDKQHSSGLISPRTTRLNQLIT